MHIGAGSLCEPLKEIFGQLGLKIANARACNFGVHDAKGPPTEIDRAGGKRLVHGHQKVSGAQNSALRAQGFGHCLAQSDSDVFDGVVLVDVQIAARGQFQIEGAVPGDEFQHVVEKTDPRGNARVAAPVQIQAELDIGLVGLAVNLCDSWHRSASDSIARNRGLRFHWRVVTAFSCAGRFSARARTRTSRPRCRKPLRPIVWTLMHFTKSAADNPPRLLAQPPVRKTWLLPLAYSPSGCAANGPTKTVPAAEMFSRTAAPAC